MNITVIKKSFQEVLLQPCHIFTLIVLPLPPPPPPPKEGHWKFRAGVGSQKPKRL